MTHHVVFISPHLDRPGKFHDLALRYMSIAAPSLGVDLTSLDASTTPDLSAAVREMLERPEPPAGVVIVNAKNMAATQLKTLDAAGVQTVVAYEGFYETDRSRVGVPGSPFESWRAEIMPDDLEVGRLLARTLLDRAMEEDRRDEDGKIRVLTLSGPFTQAATNRLTGFRDVVQSRDDVVYDLRMADWSEEKGYRLTKEYLDIFRPQVIWAANDSIARGAARALEEAGLAPGRDVLVGGVDWLGDSLQQVATGRITTSVGGHILDGIWALVMVRDALEGHRPPAQRRLASSMRAATADDASSYQRALNENYLRRIDFTERFSRIDGLYDFSLSRLLD